VIAACAEGRSANGPAASSSSRRSVWCHRSTFPVVVGEYGLVSFPMIACSSAVSAGHPGTRAVIMTSYRRRHRDELAFI
jgi:hypothetical protein